MNIRKNAQQTHPRGPAFRRPVISAFDHNRSNIGYKKETRKWRIKDEAGNTLGAIIGKINWGWLYIKALWIDESIRNEGWGQKLLYGF